MPGGWLQVSINAFKGDVCKLRNRLSVLREKRKEESRVNEEYEYPTIFKLNRGWKTPAILLCTIDAYIDVVDGTLHLSRH